MTTHNDTQLPQTIRGMHRIARTAGVSHHLVRAAVRDGTLPRLTGTGRDTVVLAEDLATWIRSLRTTTPTEEVAS